MRPFPYFAAALSGLSLLSLHNSPAQAKDVDTKTFTPSAIGFTFPEMAARTLGINGIFSGINTDAIKKELSGGSTKVDVTEDILRRPPVTNAFDQELRKLARQKFVELFGEPDKS